MGWKRRCSLVLMFFVMFTAVRWPEAAGRTVEAAQPAEARDGIETEDTGANGGMEAGEAPAARATGSEAGRDDGESSRERPGGRGTPGEAEVFAPSEETDEISAFFARNPAARTRGELEVDGESVWYLNYIKDSPDKSYAYEVLDQSGAGIDQTWWNYWWDEDLEGWRIQAKPTQYSLNHEDYSYFILDGEGALTTEIPAMIDGRPVVSMDNCFSAWALPLREPGEIPDTVVSADHCYENSDITAMPRLPEGLWRMEYMFAGCAQLEETSLIPAAVERINYGFCGAGIRETPEFSPGSRILEMQYTFKDCVRLEQIRALPDQVRSLEGTFWGALAAGADLSGVIFPDSVEAMEDTFFDSSLLIPPELPASVKTIDRCFMRCSGLTEVPLLPDGIESANQAFAYCGGLRFGDEDNVCVVAPRALAHADQMFASAYRTAGSADAWGRDSELLYLWDEAQWETIYRNAFDAEPGEESRDVYGDYNLTREPVGLSAMELLTTGPYIDSELVLEDGKRAMAVTFRGVLGRYKAPPDYYPLDVIQYRTGGNGEFQDWDGTPVYLFEDTLVEARKVRPVKTFEGEELFVTDVRAKTVRVGQPDMPVFSWKYMGSGVYDVTVMYRPFLRSMERVELKYRVDGGAWRQIENLGHIQVRCGQTVGACADWGAVSEEAVLRLPDYVTRIEVENPEKYVGLHEQIPIVCKLFEEAAGDKAYRIEIISDPGEIARVQEDDRGNWSIGNSGYGQVVVCVKACDGGGARAEHTFSFVSPVQGISVGLEQHQDGILGVGETDRAVVSVIPSGREGYRLSVSDSTVIKLDPVQGTVTGLRAGTAVLRAESSEDPAVASQMTLRVQGGPDWIMMDPGAAELYGGEVLNVCCRWGPPDAAAPEFTQKGIPVDWRIAEEREGFIRAEVTIRNEGDWGAAVCLAQSKSDPGVRGSCSVTWKPYIRVLKLMGPEQMSAGTRAATEVVTDVDSDEELRYSSSNPAVLEVSADGELTAKKAGEALITVTAGHSGASGHISVLVWEPEEKDISGLRLVLEREELKEGETCGYEVFVEPEYTSGTYSVTSSDPGVVEILDGRTLKAAGPGRARIIAGETCDPTGQAPVRDEREITVFPNRSAILEIYPSDRLWEREGKPVIYKNLPGGQAVEFGFRIITDASDRSVRWSVDREDLALIDENGVLSPRKNGLVTVTAASSAYPEVTAQYQVEIRTAATDIRYWAVKQEAGGYSLTAAVRPEDASAKQIYCRNQSAGEEFTEITGREYTLEQIGVILEFSTCTGSPTVEDVSRVAEIRSAEEKMGRYELHSFHDEAPYTVYTSDLDDYNGFDLRIYDHGRERYLEGNERSGVSWPAAFMPYGGEQGEFPDLGEIKVFLESQGRLHLQLQSPLRLNTETGVYADIHFLSAAVRGEAECRELARKEYRICSERPVPDGMSLRCLDRRGEERYRYDLSLYEGGVPEFHIGAAGQTGYTAANSEQGEVFLDINGETFTSLEACAARYSLSVYCGQENVTDRMLKGVDGRGRPRVLLIDEGLYTIVAVNLRTGAVISREVAAENAGDFANLFLECTATDTQSTSRICAIRQFRGSRTIYAYRVPYSRESGPVMAVNGVNYWNAVRLDDDPEYELIYELLADPDEGIRAEYADHRITAAGYTSDTSTVPFPENIRVTVRREGTDVAFLYGCYTVWGQLPGTELPAKQYMAAQREYRIPLRFRNAPTYESWGIGQEEIADGTVSLFLGDMPITGTGIYGDFEITCLRDGELGLICRNEETEEAELRAFLDGEMIYQRTGDPSYRGKRVGQTSCHLYVQGKAYAQVEHMVMDVGDTAALIVHCGLGNGESAGSVTAYKVLNALEDEQPLRINGGRIMALTPGQWLIQATVRFYNQAYYDVDCQFRVTVRRPAKSLTITEQNGRTGCSEGEKLYLVPGFSPEEAENVQGYFWEIKENGPGAQVDQDGVVTALQPGDYTVVLRDLPERSMTAEYTFHVEKAQVKAKSIEVSPAWVEASDGEDILFTARILPEEAENREVAWEIEGADSRSCRISRTGVFRGDRTGEYTVRCSLASDPSVCTTATVRVAVRPERIDLSGPAFASRECPARLQAAVFPADAVYQGITWRLIAGEDQAQISQNGVVTCAEGTGKATVQATIDGTDIHAEREIALGRVMPELRAEIRGADGAAKQEIRGSGDQAYLYVDGKRATGAWIAENQYRLLIKPDLGGLRIDNTGCVHGLLAGDYFLEVSREAEGMTVQDRVRVSVSAADPYNFLEIWPEDESYLIAERSGDKNMRYRLVPQLRGEDQIVWSVTSGQDIGEINDDGILRARGIRDGAVTVKCAVLDRVSGREYIAQNCTILVSGQVAGVTEIRIRCPGEVEAGDRIPVSVTILPEHAGNGEYRILISDPKIGEVRDGWFYAYWPGEVTLTAVSEDNQACEDTVRVTVRPKAEPDSGEGDDEGREPGSGESGGGGTDQGDRPSREGRAGSSQGDRTGYMTYWQLRDGKWYYYGADGAMARDSWVLYRDQWYRLGADGVMFSNRWFDEGENRYYLGNNGAMASCCWGCVDGKWYYFDQDGQARLDIRERDGFQLTDRELVYLGPDDGRWVNAGVYTYYLDERRRVRTDCWIDRDGERYYAGASGWILRNQWNEVDGDWFFMGPDGRMVRESTVWEGKNYPMDKNGIARNTGK